MYDVFVIDAIRTAVGRYGGSLSTMRPDDLLADVITAVLKRNGKIDPN
ncbi:MAG: 3-oxoadipyl-CoA thiolase, partial [Ginsengibacter sp.]